MSIYRAMVKNVIDYWQNLFVATLMTVADNDLPFLINFTLAAPAVLHLTAALEKMKITLTIWCYLYTRAHVMAEISSHHCG